MKYICKKSRQTGNFSRVIGGKSERGNRKRTPRRVSFWELKYELGGESRGVIT